MSDTIVYLLFCFKQKTAYEMRISDWSSDVCSSDLLTGRPGLVVVDVQRSFADPFQLAAQGLDASARAATAAAVERIAGLVEVARAEDVPVIWSAEERRDGKEGVSTSSSRWSPDP